MFMKYNFDYVYSSDYSEFHSYFVLIISLSMLSVCSFSEIMSFTIPNLDAFYLKTHADELLRLYYDDPISSKTVKMLEDLCRKLRTGGEKLEKYYKDCFDDLFDLLTR